MALMVVLGVEADSFCMPNAAPSFDTLPRVTTCAPPIAPLPLPLPPPPTLTPTPTPTPRPPLKPPRNPPLPPPNNEDDADSPPDWSAEAMRPVVSSLAVFSASCSDSETDANAVGTENAPPLATPFADRMTSSGLFLLAVERLFRKTAACSSSAMPLSGAV
jgi:hypothetical protein